MRLENEYEDGAGGDGHRRKSASDAAFDATTMRDVTGRAGQRSGASVGTVRSRGIGNRIDRPNSPTAARTSTSATAASIQ